ncbi:MAG: DnaJ domain-containing protein [Spirochaetota bacterium]
MGELLRQLPNLYEILQVSYGAETEELKRSFRTLAKKYHPDNPVTGSRDTFLRILAAYRLLENPELRQKYDLTWQKRMQEKAAAELVLPPERILYTTSVTRLARYGLMRVGLRNRDRSRLAGIDYDADIILKKQELQQKILIKYPLTVRIVCPECHGSDIFCPCCNGKGSYKGTRYLQMHFNPGQIVANTTYEFLLSKFRPDTFVHFKKKFLRVKFRVV